MGLAALTILLSACSGENAAGPARACGGSSPGPVASLALKHPAVEGTKKATAAVLTKRADIAFGQNRAVVCTTDTGFDVLLPDDATEQRARVILGSKGVIQFRPVKAEIPARSSDWTKTPSCADPKALAAATGGRQVCVRSTTPGGAEEPRASWGKLVLGEPVLSNGGVERANPVADPSTGTHQVSVTLTPPGAAAFTSVTGKLACEPAGAVTRQLAIVLDDIVISHPQVGEDVPCNQGISGGQVQISSGFSKEEAADLSAILTGGVLPADVVMTYSVRAAQP